MKHLIIASYRTEQLQIGSGKVSTADMHYSGRCVSVNTDMSLAITERCMDKDMCWSVKEFAEHVRISHCTVHKIIRQDLKMGKTAAKLVPRHLNEV